MTRWLFSLLFICSSCFAADGPNFISVNGSGAVVTQPDQARLTLVFSSLHADVVTGKKLVDSQTASFLAVLKQFDIAAEDINNAPLAIFPQQNEQKLDMFRIERTTIVTIRQLSQYPKLIEAAAKTGVAQLNPIELISTKSEAAYRDALKMALQSATDKAEQLAALSHRKLGTVLQIQESSMAPTPRFKGAMFAAEAAGTHYGSQSVRADLQVMYELLPMPQ